ncbi:MAG: alpha/beta hydrolase [Hyphomicrobiaceae bacterium]
MPVRLNFLIFIVGLFLGSQPTAGQTSGCPEIRSLCTSSTLTSSGSGNIGNRGAINSHAYSKLAFKQVIFYSLRQPNHPFKMTEVFDDMFSDELAPGWVGGVLSIALHHKRSVGQWAYSLMERYAGQPPPLYVYGMTPFEDDEHAELVTRELMNSYASTKALLFAHGFRTSFEDAARAIAVLHVDSKSTSVPVLVSWPSRHSVGLTQDEYKTAQLNAGQTSKYFAGVWPHLTDAGFSRVDVVAHSMGADMMLGSFEALVNHYGRRPDALGHIIFAAGDVEHGRANRMVRQSLTSPDNLVVSYCSTYDAVLFLSRQINGDRRLGECYDNGQGGAEIVKIIRAYRRQDTLRHSYLFYEPLILRDIGSILASGKTAEQRGLAADGNLWLLRYKKSNMVAGKE